LFGGDPDRETPANDMLRGRLPGDAPAMLFPNQIRELDMTAAQVGSLLLKLQTEPALVERRGT
jgi:hypothetical protein